MALDVQHKVSQATMHANINDTTFKMSFLHEDTNVLKVETTNWNKSQEFTFILFATDEQLRDLETVLHFYNLDRQLQKDGTDVSVNAHSHEKVTA